MSGSKGFKSTKNSFKGKPPLAKLMKRVPNFDHTINREIEKNAKRAERKKRQ